MQSPLPLQIESIDTRPWWRQLTSYHWFVFVMAALAWLFDCLDQQIFILFRDTALTNLMPEGANVKTFGGYATSIFVAGWATGGLIFGSLGDRIGRAKTLTITVLLYSVFTGLSALSTSWIDFAIYRFITGLGVGGVFGLAVALTADTLPTGARTWALGVLQALSAIGNVAAGLISMYMGTLISAERITSDQAWKYAFLIGAIPAFLCVFIQLRLKEPEKWVKAREAGLLTGAKFGSYASLLGPGRWRKPALLGMLLCIAGVIGLWGIGFFAPELVGDVIQTSLKEKGLSDTEIVSQTTYYKGLNSIIQNVGAFLGMLSFAYVAQRTGRRFAFAIAFVGAFLATNLYFRMFQGVDQLWMSGVMGFFQLALFAGFAIYLPELFPTRLRSTGTSFCYNVGRFLAATGPFTLGILQQKLGESAIANLPQTADAAARAAARLSAFRDATSYVSLVFIVGLVVVYFLPETKGQPLPEDD
ncbi:putative niacin/nicotinamide transporter NaiP [Rubripirellula tenax]|uniref:Putative niacin/nicotinamide transporter NaiP n=1 Tax=Rubripirellula tenax TaxID=2528015 RepID=A0A5C6F8H8_9BACT|nr:MFS transporter [Rubripirellula tenax]TWU56667.1 putative niacin/nicotinamide transporter NaiP [Rubripirellula tenax]